MFWVNLFFIFSMVFTSLSVSARMTCDKLFTDNTAFLKELKRYSYRASTRWSEVLVKEWEQIQNDPSLGKEKIAILKALGFSFENGEVKAPTHREFIRNYLKELKKRNIFLDDAILPALTIYKINEEGGLGDMRLFTPGVDAWPEGYELGGDMQVNGFVVIPHIGKGRFPLTRGSHDIFHFVSYLMNPRYMTSLRKEIQNVNLPLIEGKNILRANFYAEFLSVGDWSKKAEIENFLLTSKKISASPQSFSSYKSVIDQLPEEVLLTHAENLATNYSRFLVDLGAGVARSTEKLGNQRFNNSDNYLYMLMEKSKDNGLARVWRETPTNFSLTLLELIQTLKLSPAEFEAHLVDKIFQSEYQRFPEFFTNGKVRPSVESRKVILEFLRLHVARMEYFMWRSVNDMSFERMLQGGLRDRDFDPEVITFIGDAFGKNSNIFRSFFPD